MSTKRITIDEVKKLVLIALASDDYLITIKNNSFAIKI